MYRAKPTDDEDTLYLSPQSREHLRQMLRLEQLEGESQLVGAVKEALRMQYSRGFHEGMTEGAKNAGLPVTPPPWSHRRELSPSGYSQSPPSGERRRQRRLRRFRRRLQKAVVTMILLVLGVAALLAFNMTRPELSANNPRARQRMDWAGRE